jgi:manganese/iron transport system permease protein
VTDALAYLLEPFSHAFMQRALLMALLVAAVSAALSCFLVLRGWSLMGDAISHAVLPGLVLAHLLALPLALGAFAAGLLCALATGWLKAGTRLKEDAVLAIVFTGLFALGLVLFVRAGSDLHLDHILFGDLLGVSWRDLGETALVGLPVLATTLALRRDFLLIAFDPAHGRSLGLRVRALDVLLLVLLALAIVTALKAVGVVLVIAMLIAPGAIGFLASRRFDRMLAVAIIAASLSSVAGLWASFRLDAAAGPTIVVTQAALFAAVAVWRGVRSARQVRPAA